MREISAGRVTREVARLCIEANYELPEDVLEALRESLKAEESPLARGFLEKTIQNAEIAKKGVYPLCQDTGLAVVFVELGSEVRIADGFLCDAIQEGVRQGYQEGYLRPSIVSGPIRRENTRDNTPAVIHVDLTEGDRLALTVMPKGGGCENVSAARVLTPAQGEGGAEEFVTGVVEKAGGMPCPPIILGVGLGGTLEKAALLAKRGLLRPLRSENPDPVMAALEKRLLARVNALGIGPQGLGGRTTALAVHVETFACHIASLPVAVNIQCHSHRHGTVTI